MLWTCLPFIRSGQNHLARHSERSKKTRQTEKEVGRQHQGIDWPRVQQVPEGSGELGKMEETGCKIICGAPTTLAVKGSMMMMMMMIMMMMMMIMMTVVWDRLTMLCRCFDRSNRLIRPSFCRSLVHNLAFQNVFLSLWPFTRL